MARHGRTFPIQPHFGYPREGIGLIYAVQDYTRATLGSLPATDADLSTKYTSADLIAVATVDGSYVLQGGLSGQYVIHQFKNSAGANTAAGVTWTGQAVVAPSTATVTLQVYNQNSSTWETIASNSSAASSTNFTLTATVSNLANYKAAGNIVSFRVYQLIP